MFLVIDDIIENNVTFEFPMKGDLKAELYVKTFMGEDFRVLYKLGKWAGIDFLKSEFTGYQIYFKYKTRNGTLREKPVYITRRSGKDKFYQKINEGKKYY